MDKETLKQQLTALGIEPGDVIMLHSAFASLGEIEGGAETVIDAFLEVLTPAGTLAVPVFGKLGIITELLRKRPGAVVSSAPVGTIAAVGAKAADLCAGHRECDTAHGEGTPYAKLAEYHGKICLLGVDQDRNTFLHGIESRLELPYLCTTTATFTAPDGKETTRSYKYYPGPHRNFIGLDRFFRDAGIMTVGQVGLAQARLLDAEGALNLGLEMGEYDPAFVLCDNPACADCIKQKAAIAADTFRKEKFILAASSRLAGRYVPEMIENLQAAGIKQVELDFIQGRMVSAYSAEQLVRFTDEFRRADITVSGVRLFAAPDNTGKLLEALNAAGIKRLLLPMCATRELAEAAIKAGFQVDFFNTNQIQSRALAAAVRRRQALGENAGFCFNPANFALAGQYPFRNYRPAKVLPLLRQLDLSDALYDGTPARPAQGNGELKELISILRCANFTGYFVLNGGIRPAASLAETAADFRELLENC